MKTLVLDGTAISIQVAMSTSAATTNPTFVSTYADNAGSGITEGATDGALNGSTDVTVVPAPTGTNRRVVKDITIYNGDTAAVTLFIKYDNNATQRTIAKVTLAVGDTWTTDGTFDTNGNLKQTLGTISLTNQVTGTLPVGNGGTGATTLTGVLKGNGTSAFTAATAGTDFLAPPSGTAILKANSGGALANATAGTDYLAPPSGTAILKANSGGALANATAGTDYLAPPSGTAILKANSGGALANASAGTDYVAPGTATTFTADQTFNSTRLKLAGSTSGSATLNAPAVAGTSTYTLPPDASTLGYRNVPQSGSDKTTSYTLALTDIGEFVGVGTSGSITIPNSTFSAGDIVSIFNNTTGNITITCSITTAYIAGTNTDKDTMTLATRGVATILFISGTVCVVTGNVS